MMVISNLIFKVIYSNTTPCGDSESSKVEQFFGVIDGQKWTKMTFEWYLVLEKGRKPRRRHRKTFRKRHSKVRRTGQAG